MTVVSNQAEDRLEQLEASWIGKQELQREYNSIQRAASILEKVLVASECRAHFLPVFLAHFVTHRKRERVVRQVTFTVLDLRKNS